MKTNTIRFIAVAALLTALSARAADNEGLEKIAKKVLDQQPKVNKDELEKNYLHQYRKKGDIYYFSYSMTAKGEGVFKQMGGKKKMEYAYNCIAVWEDEVLHAKDDLLLIQRTVINTEAMMIAGKYKQSQEHALGKFVGDVIKGAVERRKKDRETQSPKKIKIELDIGSLEILGLKIEVPKVKIDTTMQVNSATLTTFLEKVSDLKVFGTHKQVKANNNLKTLHKDFGLLESEFAKMTTPLIGKSVLITYVAGEGITDIKNAPEQQIDPKDFQRLCTLYTRFAFLQHRTFKPKNDTPGFRWQIPAVICGNILNLDRIGTSQGNINGMVIDKNTAERHELWGSIEPFSGKRSRWPFKGKPSFACLDAENGSQVRFESEPESISKRGKWVTDSTFSPDSMLACHFPADNVIAAFAMQGRATMTGEQKKKFLPDVEMESTPKVTIMFYEQKSR